MAVSPLGMTALQELCRARTPEGRRAAGSERVLKTEGRAELGLSREASRPFVSAATRRRGMALRVAQGQNKFKNTLSVK